LRTIVWFTALVLVSGRAAEAQQVVTLAGRQFVLECAGTATGPTVMLLPGGSGTVEAWTRVKQGVAKFAKVCSYEPAGGARPGHRETMDEMAADLERVADRAAGPAPVVLVGHSAGGILARRFASQFPRRVAGFVLLDSSHEAQMWRFGAIAPSLLDLGFGPAWKDPETLRAMGLLPAGQRSAWHTDQPLVVIEHDIAEPPPPAAGVSPAQVRQMEAAWHAMQQDLAARSRHGELRKAIGSGTEIHRQKPDLVIQAIRDVWHKSR
jgi:pimeloyl-ACP methyl ester carboxylesterase